MISTIRFITNPIRSTFWSYNQVYFSCKWCFITVTMGFFCVIHCCHFLDECDQTFWLLIPSVVICVLVIHLLFQNKMALYCHLCGLFLVLSLSPLSFYGWVWPLVFVANSIGSTFQWHIPTLFSQINGKLTQFLSSSSLIAKTEKKLASDMIRTESRISKLCVIDF